jgi:Ca-activated chloride channel family protein
MVLPFTEDLDHVMQSIRGLQPGGSTALIDGLRVAISQVRQANNPRRALLLISDGIDKHSRYTEREIKRPVSELDIPIYTINLFERLSGKRHSIQSRDPDILETISTLTGARSFHELNPKRISSVAEMIASEIRHEYVLS